MILTDWYSSHGACKHCVTLFLDCLLYILCFLSFAVGLVSVSDGHRTARFRYGDCSVADSQCTMSR